MDNVKRNGMVVTETWDKKCAGLSFNLLLHYTQSEQRNVNHLTHLLF